MTQLLFREDAYATSFVARVEAVQGAQVRLDRTLFYAEAGGQAADQGVLRWAGAEAQVTDVQKAAAEEDHHGVWHTLQGPLPPIGATVQGELDWRRRYRHMQRHTGEHLLAQAFLRVNPAFRVVAVGMRSAQCTLDLEGLPGEADARAAENVLAEIIRRNLKIKTFDVAQEELPAFPLRRPPQVNGRVRLVGVRDHAGWWEMSACGGTHLRSTAFAAPVVVLHHERIKGGLTRMTFMAGEEAGEFLGEHYRSAREAAQLLSVSPERLIERVQATLDEAARLRGELDRTRSELATTYVRSAKADPIGDGELRVVQVDHDALVTPALRALLACPQTLGVVIAPDGRCGVTSTLTDRHAGKLLGAWLTQAGGRGGGKTELAQGQAQDGAAFEAAVRQWREQS
ncbi:alanyl-tRNA editing protein [Deinococcus peraridilitoris]|nr:alanyl-tRNA editing protein [Deinococcus peraridilitoris]